MSFLSVPSLTSFFILTPISGKFLFLIPSAAAWNFKHSTFQSLQNLASQSQNQPPRRKHASAAQISRETDRLSRHFRVTRILSARRKHTHLTQLVSHCGFCAQRPIPVSPMQMAAPEQPLPMSRGCQSSASLSPPRGDRTLLVRHLPAELTAEEKEDLLKYFGAQSVRVLSDKGRLVRARRSQATRRARGCRPGEKTDYVVEMRSRSGASLLSSRISCVPGEVLMGWNLDW